MVFSVGEIIIIGVLALAYWAWDTQETGGERGLEVEIVNKTLEKREGAQAPPPVINQKEVELIKRGMPLPEKPEVDPSLYDAELDVRLQESAGSAGLLQPMRPNRLEEYGNPSWKNAGKVMTDYLYFMYPREPIKPPSEDYYD
jgi:hypothetical protein